ncbi:TVP38/TMEM64 family protein [Clostridium fallax]|uniref:TVP38/TMEM64 family membrane protein n=1 Tax=Clostridium fallax TaxID=1533 RepID=A0A1M4SHA9_9CLOT|nr:VTT domain-containing protein [Clostridium fallax]SHE31579.1 Uncharacterized membrane protein YdjX, TVP38/TMEM64 family, SNARE-associated domain [Clostridium fallax]SQB07830.1 membrane-associated alkaline phosphatase [Clostridium fallax]
MKTKLKKLLNISLIIILTLISVYLIIYFLEDIIKIIKNPKILRDNILSYGSLSFVVFIFLQIVQCIFFFLIPGQIINITGGYIFGPYLGFLFSFIGLILGVSINYFIAFKLGKKYLMKLIPKKQHSKINKLLSLVDNNKVIFIIYLIPGTPKSLIPYICGLSGYNYKEYLIYSSMGRFPVVLVSSFIGSNIYGKNFKSLIILIVIILLGSFIGLTKGEAIANKFSKRSKKSS